MRWMARLTVVLLAAAGMAVAQSNSTPGSDTGSEQATQSTTTQSTNTTVQSNGTNAAPSGQAQSQAALPNSNSANNANNAAAGTIPAGSQISIRTTSDIIAQQPGGLYAAEIAHDVNDANGNTLIPNGSPAQLAVVQTSTLGMKQLALALQSVTVDGKTYNVQSGTSSATNPGGIGANKNTAIYVGGGAVLGTVVGAVLGHGKGAAIGAAAGAAGGALTQIFTHGNKINIPAESTVTFKLDQPLQLQAP